MSIIEAITEIPAEHEKNVFGQFDQHIKKIERTLNVTMILRDGTLKIIGDAVNVSKAKEIVQDLVKLSMRGNTTLWPSPWKTQTPAPWWRLTRTASATRSTAR